MGTSFHWQDWYLTEREYVHWEELEDYNNPNGHIFADAFTLDDAFDRRPKAEGTFHNMVNDLSDTSKEVVSVLLNTPPDFIDMMKKKSTKGNAVRVTMSQLRAYLREQGWTFTSIDKSFKEIRAGLQAL